ncbi:MAG: exodeoxyribonuclease III, partial [Kiritimatiellia bacterium]|nr:exodeoxyribonuclease III [Kiritimatiellia bacterium]
MRIATFNANSILSRMEAIVAWGDANHPDVLCIQETKVRDEEFPIAPLREAGWFAEFRGEKSYNGVAILSRCPPDEVWAGFEDDGPTDVTRLLAARFGPLVVLNTYVPQGRELTHEMYRYKLAWFGRLRRWIESRFRPEDPLLWCGDLNVARTPMDVHSPETHLNHVCYHKDVRLAFEECLQWGFTDVYRQFHPEPNRYSFYDYRSPGAVQRNIGWRIDYLLASSG